MKLHELRDNEGANRKKKRVARGPGSGKGKTAGRGIKGQTSRSGVALNGYEGGQMPLYRRLPKRGFSKPNRLEFAVVNLGQLQAFVDAGKLDAKAAVTEDALVAAGVIRRKLDGVRVLAKGELKAALDLTVAGTTAEAVAAGLADYYKDAATVKVHALNESLPENGLYSNAMAGTDRMELYLTVNAAGDQMMLVSLFDNLGKGSSGAAVQCMNLMLGLPETEGLE